MPRGGYRPGAGRKKKQAGTEGEVRRGAELTASLRPKKQAYVEGVIAGKSKRQAALAAGFSESMASHATDKIETKDVREAFAALIRETVSASEIAETLKAGLKATDTKFFAEKGVVQDQREVIDWGERRQYAELITEYGGYHARGSKEERKGGGVIIILPDPDPEPEPEQRTVIEKAPTEKGPILILPDAEDSSG